MNDMPAANLIRRLLVRQPIQRLEHQDLEHHHSVQRRTTVPGTIRAPQGRIPRRTKNLEVHHRQQTFKQIAALAQFCVAILKIEQPCLTGHCSPERPSGQGNHDNARSTTVFRGVHIRSQLLKLIIFIDSK
nr:hypothetical protein [Azospirillum humicireducens]